jgi:putative ABC transport system permease protein
MAFITLILKNLARQPVRAGLTMLGIAIGITTVVALGVITEGLKASAGQILRVGGADFIVAQEGTADLSFSNVSEEDLAAVAALPDVASATGALMDIERVGSSPFFVVMGLRAEDLRANPPVLLEGRLYADDAPDEILLGSQAAGSLDLGLGDALEIAGHTFTIVGIYETGDTWLDGGSQAPLATVQQMTRRIGQVTMIYVEIREGADIDAVRAQIEDELPQLVTVAEVSEFQEVDQGILIIDAATLAISALAVIIGAIGVMNTMIMSVFERTREIGILRAVGWSGRRILQMIIGESLLLCAVAMGLGSLLGVLVVIGVSQFETVQAFLEPRYTTAVFVRGLLVAVVVALAGALYPAIRAVRLTPMEALRHE